jgi:HK97 family phage major capsid protein
MPEFNKSEIIGKQFERRIAFDRALTVDEENRTVADIALTSENPIYHWFGYLILDHSKKSIRLDRLKTDGPVLWCHDRKQQIGRWLKPTIDEKEGKLRATAKFSRVGLGAEKFEDVKDEICQSISCGFYIYDVEPEIDTRTNEQMYKDGTPVFRSMDWEPFEASFEPTPADTNAGVNRALPEESLSSATERNSTKEENKMAEKDIEKPETKEAPVVETRSAADIAADNRLAAAKRVAEWGGVLGAQSELVTEYIRSLPVAETPTEEGLRNYLKDKQPETIPVPVGDPASTAARHGGGQQTGLELARSMPRSTAITAFEGTREEKAEKAYRFGSFMLATVLRKHGAFDRSAQFCKENGMIGGELLRALSEGVNSKGGYLVPEEFGNDLIDLRLKYGVFRRNAHVVQMSSDTRTDPRRLTGLTVNFVNESQIIPESDMTWDRVSLVAKKLAAYAVFSSELDEDAVIDIGNQLAEEIAYAFAKKEDECGFIGDGSSTYGGIVGLMPTLRNLDGTIGNVAGIKIGTGNTYAELILDDFTGTMGLMPDYVDTSGDNAKWYVNKFVYFNTMARLMLAGGGVTASEIEDRRQQRFLGYPVEFVNVLNKTEGNSAFVGFFGDLKKAATMGVRRDTTISESEHVRFQYDDIVIKGTERFDINVHSVGDNAGQPGPIAALYMKAS